VKATAVLSPKGQITIPAWVRRQLGIGPGSRVALRVEDGKLVIEREEASADRLRGVLREAHGEDPDRYLGSLRTEWNRTSA
jgi:AbrB family looped-hinge helix DNA binding protein